MKPVLTALFALTCLANIACAHVVRIDSTPGAEILVDGKDVGTAPVTYTETTGSSGPVQVTARLHGQEKTVVVDRNDMDMGAIGAGAGAGVGSCVAGSILGTAASLVFLPCGILVGVASWAGIVGGPIAGFWLSHKMPDNVKVELDVPPPVADARSPRRDGSEQSAY